MIFRVPLLIASSKLASTNKLEFFNAFFVKHSREVEVQRNKKHNLAFLHSKFELQGHAFMMQVM